MDRMLGEGSLMQLLGAMAGCLAATILLHLVASGQIARNPMLASGGQFRPMMAALQHPF